jgi:outer membrane protein assembly factor BamE (lipoprotein component of BamABCDE complex)
LEHLTKRIVPSKDAEMKLNFLQTCVAVMAMSLAACAHVGAGMYRPDLNDDIINRVTVGQNAEEITVLLGPPHRRVRFDNLKSTAWDYLYRDTWGYWVDFSVMMGDNGLVVNKVSRRIEPSDRD